MKTIDCNDSSDELLPDPALIQAALCYLMTRHTLRPCLGLVYTIMHHLQMLLAHPDMAGLPERRKVHDQLLQQWSTSPSVRKRHVAAKRRIHGG